MTNAREIINGAAKLLSVVGRGQVLSAEDAQNGLEALNDLLGMFSLQPSAVFTTTTETFNITGQESYTIGTGGNFNTIRPVYIESVFMSDGAADYALGQVSLNDYMTLRDKSDQGLSDFFAYDNNVPLSRIYFNPVGQSGYTVTITSKKAVTKFADLTTDYELPDGMSMMLKYNLAVIWAPQFEMEASPTVQATARQTKTAYMAYNNTNNVATSSMDAMFSNGSGNIYTGWDRR